MRGARRAARVGPEACRCLGGADVDAVLQAFDRVVDVAAPVVRHEPTRPEDRHFVEELAPEAIVAAMDPRVDRSEHSGCKFLGAASHARNKTKRPDTATLDLCTRGHERRLYPVRPPPIGP